MQVNMRLAPASDCKTEPENMAGRTIAATPVFFSHSPKAVACYLDVKLETGEVIGHYLLQVDGRTGKLALVEKKPLKEAPIYSMKDSEDASNVDED